MANDAPASLRFPDVPKLELDQLIDQLVERAEGVKRAQGRLRALLRAIKTVGGDLSVEIVLRNVVDAACDLAGARYGALGVIGPGGVMEQFIHVGMDDDVVERIGPLPVGKGLLGALIDDPQTIRLANPSDHPRSTGFPPEHPPMGSFLGVPINVRNEVFGNLYLADSYKGEFTEEDESLVSSLALAAGTAIAHARLYREARLRQRWLTASVEVGAHLLAASGEDPLRMVARRAMDVADADFVSVGLLSADQSALVIEVAFGAGDADLVGHRLPLDDNLSERMIVQQQPVLLRDGAGTLPGYADPGALVDVGPLMLVPLRGARHVRGALTIVRRHGRPAFDEEDLEMAAGFANHASVALELGDSRAGEQKLALLEDRDRIARDLHDHVIQELFAVGLGVESVAARLGPETPAGERLMQRVEDIDRTIRRIRSTIFELRGPLDQRTDGLRQRVLAIATDLTPALGFAPYTAFAGMVDVAVSDDLAHDVVAVVREALTNVAKHARASAVSVDLSVVEGEVVVKVEDDGVGLEESARRSGLANLNTRAQHRGGSCQLATGPNGGTRLTWKAPVR